MSRILLINPNSSDGLTRAIQDTAQHVVHSSTTVESVNPSAGPAVIEGSYDEALATYHLVAEIEHAERRASADAYVIACFGDPGLDAARELTTKPVVGIAQAAIALAQFTGATFSIVSTLPRVRNHLRLLVDNSGASSRLASLKTPNLGVLAFHEDGEEAERVLAQAAAEAVNEDGAEAIILGCAGMSGLARSLSDELGVPVIDPVEAACKLAESLIELDLGTSKAMTYQAPTQKIYN